MVEVQRICSVRSDVYCFGIVYPSAVSGCGPPIPNDCSHACHRNRSQPLFLDAQFIFKVGWRGFMLGIRSSNR